MRITSSHGSTSLAIQLSPKTINILASALIVVNAGAITTAKFALQMVRNAIFVESKVISQ